SGAVVSWGARHERRADALRTLQQVLRDSPDLDGYVAHLDKQTADNGKDSPIIRKALGQVYLERQAYAKAITQFRAAVELQPNDAEIHQALVSSYDKQGDKEGAIRQVLASAQLLRRDINRYRDLGNRYKTLERSKETERAYTSMVEVLPSESESHALLAEVREGQNRWADAMTHWKRVAQIRSLEPTGLLRLAQAQIHERQYDDAKETLRQLKAKTWPARFASLPHEVSELERKVEEARKK